MQYSSVELVVVTNHVGYMRLYKGALLTTTPMPYMGNGIDVPYPHCKGGLYRSKRRFRSRNLVAIRI